MPRWYLTPEEDDIIQAIFEGKTMICKDCGGDENVGQDRICVECHKCRAQIPPEAPDPDWDAWLKPVIDLYGPPS